MGFGVWLGLQITMVTRLLTIPTPSILNGKQVYTSFCWRDKHVFLTFLDSLVLTYELLPSTPPISKYLKKTNCSCNRCHASIHCVIASLINICKCKRIIRLAIRGPRKKNHLTMMAIQRSPKRFCLSLYVNQ